MKRKSFFYIAGVLLLYFVLMDEAADTFLIDASSLILNEKSIIHEHTIVYILLGLQILFSPLQAGFSDFYLRRKSLIVSLSATLISIFLLKLSMTHGLIFLISAIILKGILGNSLPIAWAGISDITQGKNIRFALALSICALAVGSWGSLLVLPHFSIEFFYWVVVILLVLALGSAIYPFKDTEDAPKPHFIKKISIAQMLKHECTGIYHLAKKPFIAVTLLSFLFSEISFYQILFRAEVFHSYRCLIHIPLGIGIGYTLGTLTLKFVKSSDKIVSLTGLVISTIAISIANILFLTGHASQFSFTALFSFFSFGYALFTPALFSLISPREHPHLQGKIYGLLESADSLASLLTFVILFTSREIPCNLVLTISTLMILICAFFFLFVFKMAHNEH